MGENRVRTSKAYKTYYEQVQKNIDFVSFVHGMAEHADKGAKFAAKTLAKFESDKSKKRAYLRTSRYGVGALKRYEEHRVFVRETFLTQSVNSFMLYLCQLLGAIHECRPETLRSKQTIPVNDVLEATDISDLHNALIERRVLELGYQGIHDFTADFESRTGLEIFAEEDDAIEAARLIELRNLITHNARIVNRRYLKKVGSANGKIGRKAALGDIWISTFMLLKVAGELDRRALQKFRLKKIAYVHPDTFEHVKAQAVKESASG